MHNHNCQHEKVVYCKECNKVYCECGMEWECKLSHETYHIPYIHPIPITVPDHSYVDPWTYWGTDWNVGETATSAKVPYTLTH